MTPPPQINKYIPPEKLITKNITPEKFLGKQEKYDDDLHNLRTKYLPKAFILLRNWLIFVVAFFSAYTIAEASIIYLKSKYIPILPSYVLVSFFATSTANVFGLFFICARWLFPNSKK